MVLYNTTELEAANNPYTIFTAVNNLSNGVMALFLLFVIALFLLFIFRNTEEFKRVLLGVSFIVSFLAVLFWAIQLLSVELLVFPFVFLLGSIIYNVWGG